MNEPKRRGRPPKPGGPKREHLTFRLRGDLKTNLAAAAANEARSISEEVEYRLYRSFRDDEVLAALARIEAKV